MTYLEKVKQLRPHISREKLVEDFCPESFLDIKLLSCEGLTCKECWNREMPVEVTNE